MGPLHLVDSLWRIFRHTYPFVSQIQRDRDATD